MSQMAIGHTHQEEWARFRSEILAPLYQRVAAGDEKCAKVLADILRICQDGERKALAFMEGKASDNTLDVRFEE